MTLIVVKELPKTANATDTLSKNQLGSDSSISLRPMSIIVRSNNEMTVESKDFEPWTSEPYQLEPPSDQKCRYVELDGLKLLISPKGSNLGICEF